MQPETQEPDSRKKILVVEDEDISRLTLRVFLHENGFQVVPCADGSQAVSVIIAEKPDLVILDLGLPPTDPFSGSNFDGFTILDWLQRMAPEKVPPVIVVTARDAASSKKRSLDAGAVAFFQKPADRKKLLAAIHIALSNA